MALAVKKESKMKNEMMKKLSKKARLALEGMTITPEEGSTNTLNVTVGKDEDEF